MSYKFLDSFRAEPAGPAGKLLLKESWKDKSDGKTGRKK